MTITASAATMPYCRKLPCSIARNRWPGDAGGDDGVGALEAVLTVGVVVI